ncbi:hypothetical protein HII30_05565 [Paenibacillus lemnae]|uniref:SGNH hydrolase-type esterase domain-containing protein n=2 Tax=Paenibacillus lemnae TaxID=1330551 RepID=A0A848M3T3_PAELE|nr:hypothetical protein [Paenibacillus lemnae]
MRVNEKVEDKITWYSPLEEPFQVAGLAWFAEEKKYRRMPVMPLGELPDAVEYSADHPAGGQIRFRSDSGSLSVKVKLTNRADMVHMPATGQCGIDCYVGDIGEMKYVETTKYNFSLTEYECALYQKWPDTMRTITLYLPLYQGVEEIWIGVDERASVSVPSDFVSNEKVVVYGTGITQGGFASRPGMSYTNILSRNIPLEFINLGFADGGKGEPEMVQIISSIQNQACLLLDYEANGVSREKFRTTLPGFIKIYRSMHPTSTILLVSRISFAQDEHDSALLTERKELKSFQQRLVHRLRDEGDQHIFFFDGSTLLGGDGDYFECTVDGMHPTDLGFMRMAKGLEQTLKTLLL